MFWKKKDKKEAPAATNPFESSSSFSSTSTKDTSVYSGSSYDNSNKYNDSYNSTPSGNVGGGRYGNHQQNREDLLGPDPGRRSSPSTTGRYDSQGNEDVYGNRMNRSRYGEDDEDEEVGGMKRQIRDIKQESLQSTRNALQKITEAQDSAAQSMNMLGNQSGQIANINRNLDLAKAHSDRASSQADELKQLNRSIFIPVVKNPFNKGARQEREIQKLQKEHAEHMEERDEIRKFEYESNARIDQANRQYQNTNSGRGGYRRGGGRSQADRNRYQFEADEEDDAVEDEIDNNLDLLSGITGNLKTMALTMNDELDSQLKQIDKATRKTTPVTEKLMRTTHTLDNTR